MDTRQASRPAAPEDLLRRFRTTGQPGALGALFDATAPELFRIALALAPDAAAAEDALQETFLTALEQADRWDGVRPVVPWLAGILRIEILRARRRGARVPDAARLPPPILPPGPPEEAVRAEERERVRAALEGLEEPYRSVSLLRWRYGLEPGEIAELRREPPGTVRSLLHRAGERLRKALGGLAVVVLGHRPPLGYAGVGLPGRAAARRRGTLPTGGLGTAAILGGVFMAKKSAIAAGLLAAALLAFFALRAERAGESGGGGLAAPGPVPADRVLGPALAEAPPESRPPTELPPDAPSLPPVSGRVVDRQGVPIPGALVVSVPDDLFPANDPGAGVVDVAGAGKDGARTRTVSADAGGAFVVPLDPGTVVCSITAGAPSFAPAERKGVRPGASDLVLVLDRTATLVGRVLAEEGGPVAGALVRVYGLAWETRVGFDLSVRSGPDGSYRLEGVPPNRLNNMNPLQLCVSVGASGFAPLYLGGRSFFEQSLPEFPPGAEVRQDFHLSRGSVLTGRVLDFRTKEPVPGATVIALAPQGARGWPAELPSGGPAPWEGVVPPAAGDARVLSGPDGSFTFQHFCTRGFHRSAAQNFGGPEGLVVAWKEGWSTGLGTVMAPDGGEGAEALVLLSPAAAVEGRVVDGEGKPLAEALVQASPGDPASAGGMLRSFLWGLRGYPADFAVTDGSGRYRMDGIPLRDGVPTALRVAGTRQRPLSGFARGPDGEVVVEGVPGGVAIAPDLVLGEPELSWTPFLVVDGEGRPVPGASFRAGQRHDTASSPVEYASLRTGPDGRGRLYFDWGETDPFQIAVDVAAPGFAWTREFVTPEAGGGDEVRVVLRRGLELTGSVLRADGSPDPGAWVTVADGRATADDVFPPDENRAARSTDAARYYHGFFRVEEDGKFHARDLPEGPYMVCAQAFREHGGAGESRFLRTIATGVATNATDLVITLPPDEAPAGAHLECTVTDAATGKPVVRFGAALYGEEGRRIDGVPVAPGRSAFEGVTPGTWSLSVASSGYCATILPGMEVREGAPPPSPAVALERGAAVHGTVRRADGTPVSFYDLGFSPLPGSAAGAQAVTVPLQSPDGRFRVGGFRPGRYRFEVKSTTMGWPNLLPVNGETVVVPEGAVEVPFDVVVAPVGTLDVYAKDPRLPVPAGMGAEAVAERVQFGADCRLVVLGAGGAVVAERKGVDRSEYTPALTCSLPEGSYRVRLEMPGGEAMEETVVVSSTERRSVSLGER